MKKTCSVFVVAYLVLFAGYYWFLQARFENPPLLVLSFLGAMGLFFFLAGIAGLFTGTSDKAVLAKAGQMTMPKDGKKAAVSGIVQPTGLSLCRSPLSGEDCVAYEYKFQTRNNTGDPVEYSGYGMSSCAIRASYGDVRLLSFPVLDAIGWESAAWQLDPDEDQSEMGPAGPPASIAQEYIANTKFREVKINELIQTFEEMFADKDGVLKTDLCKKLNREQYDGDKFWQRTVRAGAEVCALGRFSAKQNALVGEWGFKTSIIRLFPGNAEMVSRTIGREYKVTITFGLVFFLLIHAFLFVAYKYRYTNASASDQFSDLQIAAQDHDLKTIERMLDGGVDVNLRDSDGKTLLLVNSRDTDVVAMLIKHHADLEARDREWDETALFEAVREGPIEVVQMLIRAGANVNAVSKKPDRHTPLNEAVRAQRPDVEKMLMGAGAVDDRVTAANGNPIQPNDDVVATFSAFMDAIYGKDVDTMMKLTGNTNRKAYNTTDFSIWQGVRVHHPDSISGYKNEQTATLRVEGPMPDGTRTAWWYQLTKNSEGKWVIDREWWETPQH
jgi:hypothetical protein